MPKTLKLQGLPSAVCTITDRAQGFGEIEWLARGAMGLARIQCKTTGRFDTKPGTGVCGVVILPTNKPVYIITEASVFSVPGYIVSPEYWHRFFQSFTRPLSLFFRHPRLNSAGFCYVTTFFGT